MTTVRGSLLLGVVLVVALSSACRRNERTPALTPVALPDISSAAESVQTQIRDRYQSLQAAIDRKAPAPELATAYGEMGKMFVAAEYYDAAEACLRNAQQLAPADRRWPYFLGHVFRFHRITDIPHDQLENLVLISQHQIVERPGLAPLYALH